jgi:hypothetical protein
MEQSLRESGFPVAPEPVCGPRHEKRIEDDNHEQQEDRDKESYQRNDYWSGAHNYLRETHWGRMKIRAMQRGFIEGKTVKFFPFGLHSPCASERAVLGD